MLLQYMLILDVWCIITKETAAGEEYRDVLADKREATSRLG